MYGWTRLLAVSAIGFVSLSSPTPTTVWAEIAPQDGEYAGLSSGTASTLQRQTTIRSGSRIITTQTMVGNASIVRSQQANSTRVITASSPHQRTANGARIYASPARADSYQQEASGQVDEFASAQVRQQYTRSTTVSPQVQTSQGMFADVDALPQYDPNIEVDARTAARASDEQTSREASYAASGQVTNASRTRVSVGFSYSDHDDYAPRYRESRVVVTPDYYYRSRTYSAFGHYPSYRQRYVHCPPPVVYHPRPAYVCRPVPPPAYVCRPVVPPCARGGSSLYIGFRGSW